MSYKPFASVLLRQFYLKMYKPSLSLNYDEPPQTPPEIKMYRRSNNQEPGKRILNHAQIRDAETLKLEDKAFGRKNVMMPDGAKNMMSGSRTTIVDRLNTVKSEMLSKTQYQLGKSKDLGTLPLNFDYDAVRGVKDRNEQIKAKDVIFPMLSEDSVKGEDLYKRSHGSYGAGEQKVRDYQWPIDPNTTRFGSKSDVIPYNGVSKGAAECLNFGVVETGPLINKKEVEDFRDMSDILGRSRNRGQGSSALPFEHVYGQSNQGYDCNAAQALRGNYSEREQLPDADLGKSLTPGFRNIAVESRSFGVPTVRTDLPEHLRGKKSITDAQNYGDCIGAKDLISPPVFSDTSLPEGAFTSKKPQRELERLFEAAGFSIRPDVADAVMDIASDGTGEASIIEYRQVLNQYIVARDLGREDQWLRSHGLS